MANNKSRTLLYSNRAAFDRQDFIRRIRSGSGVAVVENDGAFFSAYQKLQSLGTLKRVIRPSPDNPVKEIEYIVNGKRVTFYEGANGFSYAAALKIEGNPGDKLSLLAKKLGFSSSDFRNPE